MKVTAAILALSGLLKIARDLRSDCERQLVAIRVTFVFEVVPHQRQVQPSDLSTQ